MKVCIIGGGAGGRSASGRIRELDKEAQIDVFTKQPEIGYAPFWGKANKCACEHRGH